jgi:hypothetical protein
MESIRGDLHHQFDLKKGKLLLTRFLSLFSIAAGVTAVLLILTSGNAPAANISRHNVLILLQIFVENPVLLIMMILTALLIFTGYGIHGSKLGTFPDVRMIWQEYKGRRKPAGLAKTAKGAVL